MNVFLYLMVFHLLFLGYYDIHFVKFILLGLLTSCLLDFVYIYMTFIGAI